MHPTAWIRLASFGFILLASGAGSLLISQGEEPQQWYKGNLHTHTINSDGDSAPDAVARWYKENHYQFLALTDHNYFTDPQGLNEFLGASERFLLLAGEEVTSRSGDKPIHVNAFGLGKTIEPRFGADVTETIQLNVDAIRAASALPSLNHPNFIWGVEPGELSSIERLGLFEVFNGHPTTNDFGGGGAPGLEAMWDHVLSAGRRMFGIAVDDAHVFKHFSPDASNPGRGWVHVQAAELTSEAIHAALEAGDFYASNGVELERVDRGPDSLRIRIKERRQEKYAVRFIGAGGKLLTESLENPAEYRLQGGEGYVRAVVLDSNGRSAWVQPVFER